MKTFPSWEQKTLHHRISYTRLRSWLGGRKSRASLNELSAYLIFIGYPRSGHSIIGALLDAHPNMVVSNELDSLLFFELGYSKHQIAHLILENTRQIAEGGRSNTGYNYAVPGQWQGQHQSIQIIGDKDGGGCSRKFVDHGHHQRLEQLRAEMGVPLKILHVVRNPFDNLSTIINRTMKNSGQAFSERLWNIKCDIYFNYAAANEALIADDNYNVLTVYQEDFLRSPKDILKKICSYLEIDAPKDYLQDCASIVWNKPNKSRLKSDIWSSERIAEIERRKANFTFLRDYQFST